MRKSLIITGAVAAALLATGLTGDRWAASTAAERLAERLRCAADLPQAPEVSLGGFPFLTQVARGTFTKVQVKTNAITVGRFHTELSATARTVRTAGGTLQAASLTATATIRYAEMSALTAGASADGLGYDGAGRLRTATTVHLFGKDIPVVVHASPEISGTSLLVRPTEVEVPAVGMRLPATQLGDRAGPRTIDLPALPAGLSYSSASATESGLEITVAGRDLSVAGRNGKNDQGCGAGVR